MYIHMVVLRLHGQIGILKCWFLRRGKTRVPREKTSQSKGEDRQQTRPTYDVNDGC